jgi:hypothetical protein
MNNNGLVVIVDYNNRSRVKDVQHLTSLCHNEFSLKTLLVREKLDSGDTELADCVFRAEFHSPDFVTEVMKHCEKLGYQVKGVAPFSDRSLVAASRLAAGAGVIGDSAEKAVYGVSKLAFRRAEGKLDVARLGPWLFRPAFASVSSLKEVIEFSRFMGGRDFILKPSCEGNNRGVIRVGAGESLADAFQHVKPFLSEGAICEQLIDFESEFSFDGVGDLSFVTKKITAQGKFPVELGQMVGVHNLSPEVLNRISFAGSLANHIVGQSKGAFHNEVRYCENSGRVAIVEPNRRPAGMRIWDLARAATSVCLYRVWLQSLLGYPTQSSLPFKGINAGLRMFRAPVMGKATQDVNLSIEELLRGLAKKLSCENLQPLFERFQVTDFSVVLRAGEGVTSLPKTNVDFIGSICATLDTGCTNELELIFAHCEAVVWDLIRDRIEWDAK